MVDAALYNHIGTLASSRNASAAPADRECKLCGSNSAHFDYVDFGKSCENYPLGRSWLLVEYFRCERCELIFTDFCDEWSAEDFSRFIYNADYIKVDPEYVGTRPRRAAEELSPSLAGAEDLRILDYGSGSGIFEQEMESRGFARVESYDPFSSPAAPTGRFDIVTCFDVIEHSPTPKETLEEILAYLKEDGVILVGQTLQPPEIEQLRADWWYIAPRNGHITTYSTETMRLFAEREGVIFDDFGDLFALSYPQRSSLSQSIIARRHPKQRRHIFHAPAVGGGPYGAWHEAEGVAPDTFRWTRENEVSFGSHPFPAGECRIVIPFHMAISDAFLAACSVHADSFGCSIAVRGSELMAVFNFPEPAVRHVMLRTPGPVAPSSLRINDDLRSLGIAIRCA